MRVPVFSAVWLNKILHHVSPANAMRLCEENKAFPINGGNAIRLVDVARSDDRTSSSLTAFDAQVAAGEYGMSRTARMGERKKQELAYYGKKTEDAVESSSSKLALWKVIKDEKATLV